jgi:uncharacterized protein
MLLVSLSGCAKEKSRTIEKKGRISDFANILEEATRMSLSSELEQYEKDTCHQVYVLIVQSLKGETITELSTRTALSWEIGHSHLKNGILLSIAIDEGQARIEMGPIFEYMIQEGVAEQILKNEMFPSFRTRKMEEGILKGIRAVMEEARKLEFSDELKPSICR